jgi:glucose/arabinose dehydrogenase
MKKKFLLLSLIAIFLFTIFFSLWSLIEGGYDKQNRLVLVLKKIIPRSLAVKIRDTIFIVPELKTRNKLLQIQVDKYEQGLQGKLYNKQKIKSDKDKNYYFKEFYLPFRQLDIKSGWNKLSNTFRAHYLEIINDKIIVMSGEGDFIYFEKKNINSNKLSQNKIESNIKNLLSNNKDEFFGVRDILYDDEKIYITAIIKNNNGFTLNVYEADLNLDYLNFSTFFEKKEFSKNYTIQTGGRLESYQKNKILLSFGAAESLKNERVQSDDYLEGKIISIDKSSRKYEIISKGHRNPQGLFFSNNLNLIINSEHGPKGGDEINFNFRDNKKKEIINFGWPIASYGKEYDGSDPYKKSHSRYGFEEPFKNYTPSIGISEILLLQDNKIFDSKSIVVSSLRAGSIYVLNLNEDLSKIVSEDRIFFGDQRIRDIKYDEEFKRNNFYK